MLQKILPNQALPSRGPENESREARYKLLLCEKSNTESSGIKLLGRWLLGCDLK